MRDLTKKIVPVAAIVAMLAASGAASLRAQIQIGDPNGVQAYALGHSPYDETYGQTITAPLGAVTLNDFSFWVYPGTNDPFNAYVYAWDNVNNRATGGALYTSSLVSTVSGSGPQEMTFTTPGIAVSPGDMYVLFLSVSGNANLGTYWNYNWDYYNASPYAGGAFMWQDTGDNTANWTGAAWNLADPSNSDLQFQADFNVTNVTPEPASMVLLATGLLGMGGLLRFRRKKNA